MERQHQILEAASRLLLHYGPAKTTVADIAREAGISVGSVYLEFKSKDDILVALSSHRYAHVLAAMRAAAQAHAAPAERLAALLMARLDAFLRLAAAGITPRSAALLPPRRRGGLAAVHRRRAHAGDGGHRRGRGRRRARGRSGQPGRGAARRLRDPLAPAAVQEAAGGCPRARRAAPSAAARWPAGALTGVAFDPDLYDRLHTGNDGDVAFYRRWCAGASGVLELGCGSGRILAALAADGHALVGVDLHPGMCARARARVPGARIVEADMAEVDLGERFDRVLLPYNSLYCAPDDAGVVAVLARAAHHLRPEGRVIFDGYRVLVDADELIDDEAPEWIATLRDGARRIEVLEQDRHQPARVTAP
ncbi:MAG: TetR family transcriptional regulator [bacterium]